MRRRGIAHRAETWFPDPQTGQKQDSDDGDSQSVFRATFAETGQYQTVSWRYCFSDSPNNSIVARAFDTVWGPLTRKRPQVQIL